MAESDRLKTRRERGRDGVAAWRGRGSSMTRVRVRGAVVLTTGAIAVSVAVGAFAQEAPQLEREALAGQSRAPAQPGEPTPDLGWTGPLGLVLLLAAAGSYVFVKRRRYQRVGFPSAIQLVGSVRIGPNAHAVVTTVRGKVFVLGVTDQNVTTLATLDDASELAELALRATSRPSADAESEQADCPDSVRESVMILGPRKFRDMLREALSRPEVAAAPTARAPAALPVLEDPPLGERAFARQAEPPPPPEAQREGLRRWSSGGER